VNNYNLDVTPCTQCTSKYLCTC